MHDYSTLFDLYPLLSAAYILWALCHFRWHICKGIDGALGEVIDCRVH